MDILAALNAKRVLVSDGAWGTFLQSKGLQPGECPELWNETHREAVLDIARSYIKAGADVIETNSFGGNAVKLAHYGFSDRASELSEKAAEISRQAAGMEHGVLGSIGPSGKILLMGDVTEEELYEAFRVQAQALERGGADAVICETFAAIDEATIAVKAAKENTRLPVICTFTFNKISQNEYRTMMGVSPAEAAAAALEAGADMIGTNCGNGMAQMVDIVRQMRAAAPQVPIVVHANAGAPILIDDQTVFPETPSMMADLVPALIEAGADIIGGCCGTTPEHIRAIAAAVRRYTA
ncbi:MAG: homocysteine S-methyltransferase family protein [candidate division KSB1 bacterium]|nr:homocysteine S-methyltransferase family protein [candidate division KSB1 bacterium]